MAQNSKKNTFSIIIPARQENDYLRETLGYLQKQKYKNFEVLVITDQISLQSDKNIHHLGPSYKRNLGAKMAQGKYLAFLDDDSYPDSNWLQNAKKLFSKNKKLAAVCGPCLTPPKDNIYKQASGLFWSSFLGSGGAGTYRNNIYSKRYVDDYPTVNLIVKKTDFQKINGFNNKYWPGEDTILCLDIVNKLKKKILYHPSVLIYHHRRNVFIPHLQQITRYAIHRGYFAKIYPQTSFRIGYFLPSLFSLYITSLMILFIFNNPAIYLNFYLIPLYFYLLSLLFTFFFFLYKNKNFYLSFLASLTIPITHVYYGILFIIGFSKSEIAFQPHQHNTKTGQYIGG